MTRVSDLYCGRSDASEDMGMIRPMPARPLPSRVVEVMTGMDEWTVAEGAWIAEHPEFLEYQQRLRKAMERIEKSARKRAEEEEVVEECYCC